MTVCIRPEHLSLRAGGSGFAGALTLSLPQGAHIIQEVRLHSGEAVKVVQSRSDDPVAFESGSPVVVELRPRALVNAFAA